jgi:hypothetical protein
VQLVRALGEGWRAFSGGAERGVTLAAPGVSAGLSGEPSRELNWIVAYGPEGVADDVARAVHLLRERGLPGVVYAASPVAGDVAAVAGDLGLRDAGTASVMCVHATDVVRAESTHDIRRVADAEGGVAACGVLADAFDLPADWYRRLLGADVVGRSDAELFLSLHGDRPVAVAGGAKMGAIAGIFVVGTVHTHRRRGAGATAVTAALDFYLGAGAHWCGVLSAPATEPFFTGFGFVAVDHAGAWTVEGA